MQLVRALANPARIRIINALAEGPATPTRLSTRMHEKNGVIAYHLKVLRTTGCIQQSESDQLGPAEERVYELAADATPTRELGRSWPTGSGVGHPPAVLVRSVVERGSSHRGEDLFGARQNQLSCTSIVVDKQGWREISAAIGEALDRIATVHERSVQRLSNSDEEGINATIAVANFESSVPRAAGGI